PHSVYSDVPGGSRSRGAPGGSFPTTRADGNREDQNGRGAGRSFARQRKKSFERGLRKVPDGTRSRQADLRASRLSRPSRDTADPDPAEAQFGYQRKIRALDRAV